MGSPALQGNYLVVEQGWLFTRTLYIPLPALHAQDANGIYLHLTKEELQDEQWKIPPGGGSALEATPSASAPPTADQGQEHPPPGGRPLPGPLSVIPSGTDRGGFQGGPASSHLLAWPSRGSGLPRGSGGAPLVSDPRLSDPGTAMWPREERRGAAYEQADRLSGRPGGSIGAAAASGRN